MIIEGVWAGQKRRRDNQVDRDTNRGGNCVVGAVGVSVITDCCAPCALTRAIGFLCVKCTKEQQCGKAGEHK